MRYFLLSLGLSLRAQLRRRRFWLGLALALALGLALRWTARQTQPDTAAVQAGIVLADGGEAFREALEVRGGGLVHFIRTDEKTARAKVASAQWDCALLLPNDFDERLAAGETEELMTLLTGPGSTVYPLIRETAAAALLELSSASLAADYLLSSGIADEISLGDIAPRLQETLPQARRVRIKMETLEGRPMTGMSLAGDSLSRVLRGSLAAALLVWTLFAAVDLGRWRQSGAARRMRPCQGDLLLGLPRLLAALIPGFLLAAVGIVSSGDAVGSALALLPYLGAVGAAALLLAAFQPVWKALPAVIPFAAASVFVLSPVFVDVTLLFPRLRPLSRWLPVTLYLKGCEGDGAALGRLLILAAVFACTAAAQDVVRRKKISP